MGASSSDSENTPAHSFVPQAPPRKDAEGSPTTGFPPPPAFTLETTFQTRSELYGCVESLGQPWLFAFATLFLAASWLVELRYVAVPLVLWLAMREHRARAVEWATFALWLALAVWVMDGILAQRLFL